MVDFVAGVVGIIISLIAFFVLSTLFVPGWAVFYGSILGWVFSWITYLILKRRDTSDVH